MAVESSKRASSNLEFLENARKIAVFAVQRCLRWPKRYQHVLSDRIIVCSLNVLLHCKAANSIYVSNRQEAQKRDSHLVDANINVQQIVSLLDVARMVFEEAGTPIKDTVWLQWFKLLDDEGRLIGGIRKSDRERFKSLG